jgi:WD40 repeat protein
MLRRLGDFTDQVMAVAISPDGTRVVTGGASARGSGVIHSFDPTTGARAWSVDDHAAEVLAVVFTRDGSSLATASADGSVRIRDPQTGAVLRVLTGHTGGATGLAFSSDGKTLLCGQGLGGARLWEAATGRLLQPVQSAESKAATISNDRLMTSVGFMPDGATFFEGIASVGNTYGEKARFWDVHSGQLVREISGGRPLTLSPDGSLLAAGG